MSIKTEPGDIPVEQYRTKDHHETVLAEDPGAKEFSAKSQALKSSQRRDLLESHCRVLLGSH